MQHARWLAKLGSQVYDLLIMMNRFVNFLLAKFGRPRVALSKLIKERVKTAVAAINNFKQTAANLATDGYRYMACGHLHQPKIKTLATPKNLVMYLNSGDQVKNLTALYCTAKAGWQLYYHHHAPTMRQPLATAPDQATATDAATLLEGISAEFKIK